MQSQKDAPWEPFKEAAEAAFEEFKMDPTPERTEYIVSTVLISGSSELAFFTLLRACISGPLRKYAEPLADVIIDNHDAEWACSLLQTLAMLSARDPDLPYDATQQPPLLSVAHLEALVDVVRDSNEPEWMYHTLRTVFLTVEQKRKLLVALQKTRRPKWAKLTVEDVRLSYEERSLLYSKRQRMILTQLRTGHAMAKTAAKGRFTLHPRLAPK